MSLLSAALVAGSQQQFSRYPTIQQLKDAATPFQELPEKFGLIWQLNGPLDSAAVLIKQGTADPEHYYDIATHKIHPLAISSLTEPKTSSITVRVTELALWEDNWLERHEGHFDPDTDGNGPDVEWRSFPDWDPEVDEGEMQLVKCCGEMRPRVKETDLTVTPASDGAGYVTVHDYLSAVHPWLMSRRSEIPAALATLYDQPVDPNVQLSVNSTSLEDLTIETELNMFPVQGGSPILSGAEPVRQMGIEDWPSPYDPETLRQAGIPLESVAEYVHLFRTYD